MNKQFLQVITVMAFLIISTSCATSKEMKSNEHSEKLRIALYLNERLKSKPTGYCTFIHKGKSDVIQVSGGVMEVPSEYFGKICDLRWQFQSRKFEIQNVTVSYNKESPKWEVSIISPPFVKSDLYFINDLDSVKRVYTLKNNVGSLFSSVIR